MTLRNVPKSFTLEQQRLEINELAVDLDAAVDGVQTFTGVKTFDDFVTFSADVTFEAQSFWGDGDQAIFGNDSDFKIYYDGSVGVETSFIDSDALQIRSESDTSELYATFLKDGPVELYYDGDKKFGTNSTGASVVGTFDVSGASEFSGATNLISGSNKLNFNTNTNQEGQLWANSDYFYINSSATFGMNIQSNAIAIRSATGGENYLTASINNGVLLYHDDIKKFETTATGISITGNIDSVTDISASGDVALSGITSNFTVAGPTTFNNDVALADDKVLNFGASSDGRISYTSSTNRFYVRTPGGSADLILGAGPAVRITNEDGLTDRAVFDANGLTVTGTIDADDFTINGSPLQTDVATTSSVGTVQPDGTTIGIDANGVISVTGGGDPFTANGFKFGVNEATGPAATLGEFRQISGKPYFYDGTAWQEFILGSTQQVTIPAETAWDKVIVRSTFDSDFDDVKFGDTGNPNTYTAGYNGVGINASTLVATPAKFGTNVLKSVGNGVVYPHRAEYDFTGEFTIECWVYFDSAPASYTQAFLEKHVIFSKANAAFTDGSWQVYVKQAANGNHFWYIDIHDTATNTETQYQLDSIGSGWSTSGYDQQWVHIALVKESDGTLHFYKNGVDGLYTVQDLVSGNDITNTTFDLAIGMPQEGGQAINDIYIDDLRITTDARYTSSGVYTAQDFTPPTSAHPISGTTTSYTPPPTSKAGEITLGATPTWTGTAGVTVSQTVSGTYRMSFTNPFANATDYYVITNHMDYPGGQAVFVHLTRAAGYIDFIVYRDGDGNPVDLGSLAVQVIAH